MQMSIIATSLLFSLYAPVQSQNTNDALFLLLDKDSQWIESSHGCYERMTISDWCTFYTWGKTIQDEDGKISEAWFSWWIDRLEEKNSNQPVILKSLDNLIQASYILLDIKQDSLFKLL